MAPSKKRAPKDSYDSLVKLHTEPATTKRKQHCTLCKNHDYMIPKNGHVCKYKGCTCDLCKLTTISKTVMKYQQALWRHQLKELSKSADFLKLGIKKKQLCDKCRNHSVFCNKRGHKTNCKYETCSCPHCDLTDKRRLVMKYQQRVRRNNVVACVVSDDSDCSSDDETSTKEDDCGSIKSVINSVSQTINAYPRNSSFNNILDKNNTKTKSTKIFSKLTVQSRCNVELFESDDNSRNTNNISPQTSYQQPVITPSYNIANQDDTSYPRSKSDAAWGGCEKVCDNTTTSYQRSKSDVPSGGCEKVCDNTTTSYSRSKSDVPSGGCEKVCDNTTTSYPRSKSNAAWGGCEKVCDNTTTSYPRSKSDVPWNSYEKDNYDNTIITSDTSTRQKSDNKVWRSYEKINHNDSTTHSVQMNGDSDWQSNDKIIQTDATSNYLRPIEYISTATSRNLSSVHHNYPLQSNQSIIEIKMEIKDEIKEETNEEEIPDEPVRHSPNTSVDATNRNSPFHHFQLPTSYSTQHHQIPESVHPQRSNLISTQLLSLPPSYYNNHIQKPSTDDQSGHKAVLPPENFYPIPVTSTSTIAIASAQDMSSSKYGPSYQETTCFNRPLANPNNSHLDSRCRNRGQTAVPLEHLSVLFHNLTDYYLYNKSRNSYESSQAGISHQPLLFPLPPLQHRVLNPPTAPSFVNIIQPRPVRQFRPESPWPPPPNSIYPNHGQFSQFPPHCTPLHRYPSGGQPPPNRPDYDIHYPYGSVR